MVAVKTSEFKGTVELSFAAAKFLVTLLEGKPGSDET